MGTNGEIRRFRDSRKSGGVLIELPRPRLCASPSHFVKTMSRRNAPGPSFEIVPRDRPLRRRDMRADDGSIEAQQLGPRLQKVYSPCTGQHPEDIRTLIVALDHRLQKQ
jgi:hypothetical protein